MGFLARIEAARPHETLQAIELAAEDRFYDGIALSTAGDPSSGLAALYLWCYVPELLLKCAWYRQQGVRPSDDLEPHRRNLHRAIERKFPKGSEQARHVSRFDPPSLHDPVALLRLLKEDRDSKALAGGAIVPMAGAEFSDARFHAERIRSHAAVSLRYESHVPTARETGETLASAEWFLWNRHAFGVPVRVSSSSSSAAESRLREGEGPACPSSVIGPKN